MTDPKPCPICKAPMTPEFAPFCSKRCKLLDLGAWGKEEYKIKGKAVEDAIDSDDVPSKED